VGVQVAVCCTTNEETLKRELHMFPTLRPEIVVGVQSNKLQQ
jgi:hypothetical protein